MLKSRVLASMATAGSAAIALSSCSVSGGGSGSTPGIVASAPASAAPAARRASVAVVVRVPPPAVPAAGARRPQYVSPSTAGMQIALYASPKTANETATVVVDADLTTANTTPAASGCTADANDPGRTCTVTVIAPVGTYDFVVTTYDAAPSSSNGFANARQLGTGTVPSQTLTSGALTAVNVALGGTIASLRLAVPVSTNAYDAQTLQVGIVALDAADNVIVAGTSDPYSTPVSLSLAAPNGTGATLSLNGTAATTSSVTVAHSSDTVTLAVPAQTGAQAGSFASLTASAGALTASATLAPFLLTAPNIDPSSTFTTGDAPSFQFTKSGLTQTITLTRYNAAAFTSVNPAGSCNGITVGPLSATATNSTTHISTASFTLTSTTGNSSGCSIVLGDGTTSITFSFGTNLTTGTGSVSTLVPGKVLYATSFAGTNASNAPTNPASVDNVTDPAILIYRISDGSLFEILDAGLKEPLGIAHDAAGNVYVADGQSVKEYPQSSIQSATAPTGTSTPSATFVGIENAGPDQLNGVAVDQHNGNVYVTDSANNALYEYAGATTGTGGNFLSYVSLGAKPAGVALDSSGDVYVAFPNATSANEYAPLTGEGGATVLQSYACGSGDSAVDVKVGSDNGVFVDCLLSNGADIVHFTAGSATSDRSYDETTITATATGASPFLTALNAAPLAVDGSGTIYGSGNLINDNGPTTTRALGILMQTGATTGVITPLSAVYPASTYPYMPYLTY